MKSVCDLYTLVSRIHVVAGRLRNAVGVAQLPGGAPAPASAQRRDVSLVKASARRQVRRWQPLHGPPVDSHTDLSVVVYTQLAERHTPGDRALDEQPTVAGRDAHVGGIRLSGRETRPHERTAVAPKLDVRWARQDMARAGRKPRTGHAAVIGRQGQ